MTMGKRIVSKGEYVKLRGKQLVLKWYTYHVVVLTTMLGFIAAFGMVGIVASLWHLDPYAVVGGIILTAVFAKLTSLSSKNVKKLLAEVHALEPIAPLTRANTADLPAPETLVRAAAEPVQAQKATLLRPSIESVEKHEEQLVRAVNEQEKGGFRHSEVESM